MSAGLRGSKFLDVQEKIRHAHGSVFPRWSQVKRTLNPRIEGCCAGGIGDDPYPEIEDVHSSRIEDCDIQADGVVAFLKSASKPTRGEGSSLAGGRSGPPRDKVSDEKSKRAPKAVQKQPLGWIWDDFGSKRGPQRGHPTH